MTSSSRSRPPRRAGGRGGPMGLGGILAEVLDDVVVLLAPVTAVEVRASLGRLRGAQILRGVRGRPSVDLDALVHAVLAIAGLLVDDRVLEVDANPLIAHPAG